GQKNAQTDIARNLKNLGIPLDAIAQASGLSRQEIDSL
ncbi:MAG: hypothetical protein RR365_01380, partial [Bacteroides sp.]